MRTKQAVQKFIKLSNSRGDSMTWDLDEVLNEQDKEQILAAIRAFMENDGEVFTVAQSYVNNTNVNTLN